MSSDREIFYAKIFLLVRSFTVICFVLDQCSAVIGEIDEELDSEINLVDIRAEPLNAVVH